MVISETEFLTILAENLCRLEGKNPSGIMIGGNPNVLNPVECTRASRDGIENRQYMKRKLQKAFLEMRITFPLTIQEKKDI